MGRQESNEAANEAGSLLDRVRAGDRAAFDSLVRRFWEPVMRFLWKRVSRQTAEDLAQEVFVAVYKTLRQGGGPRGNDPAIWQRYLLTSARNVVIDHWRRERLSPPAAGLSDLLGGECLPPEQGLRPAAEQAAPADPLSAEQFAAIRECMDRLDVLPGPSAGCGSSRGNRTVRSGDCWAGRRRRSGPFWRTLYAPCGDAWNARGCRRPRERKDDEHARRTGNF